MLLSTTFKHIYIFTTTTHIYITKRFYAYHEKLIKKKKKFIFTFQLIFGEILHICRCMLCEKQNCFGKKNEPIIETNDNDDEIMILIFSFD